MAVHETALAALAKAYPAYPGAGSPYVGEERMHPREIIKILRRRRTIITATILSLTSLAALIAFGLPAHYTAATSVVIDPRATRLVNTERALDEQPQDKSTLETEIRLLQSRSQARAVIEHAGLLADPEFNPPKQAETSVAALLARYRPLLAKWLPESWLVQTGLAMAAAPPEATAPEVVVAETGGDGPAAIERTIDRFLSRLSIQQAGAANVLTIQFSSSDPEKAARIANDAAELYIARKLEAKQAAAARGASWLSDRLAQLRTQLLDSEAAVATYRAQHELIDSSNGMTLDGAQLAALNSELIRVQAELAEKRAKLNTLRALRNGKQSLESVPEVLASPVMANLRQQQTELLRQRAQEFQEYGPRHPRILQLEADQRELEEKIRTEILNIVGAFERDVAVTENRERMLRQSLAQTKGHVVQNNQAEVQLGQLEREAEANRALYTTFLERFKTLTEQQEVLEPGVEVISAAAVPSTRSFPQPKLVIAAGFTSSLVFATLLAFIAESLENGLRSGRQIEEALGLANLGMVPWVKGGFKLHHYLAQKPRSAYAEAVRGLHIGMKFASLDRPPKIILVTSSLPNEGKTTLAVSLGASTAAAGHKTVVVDLDLRHPSVRRELNQPVTAPGLVELIAGEATLEQVTHIDEVQPNLHVITVRRNPSNPIDLIGSQRMSALMTQLRSRYKYVILDAPPVLGISDTRLAALLADAVLFVVRWGKTKAEVAQNAMNALRESHAPVAGAVLTQVDIERHAKRAYGDAVEYYGQYKQYYID